MLLRDEQQLRLAFVEKDVPAKGYEYAVLVTDLAYDTLAIAQLYRDRGDAENAFDELKNQWGWGGFTTHDLQRCRLTAMTVALTYNWWSLFVRRAHPEGDPSTKTGQGPTGTLRTWGLEGRPARSTGGCPARCCSEQ